MKYLLYHAPAAVLRELAYNAGIDIALARAEELRRRGIPVELVDISGMAPSELQGRYIEAIGASVVKKYRLPYRTFSIACAKARRRRAR
jgi:hypothetical protein